jgi:hypothetical protein
MPTSPVTIKKNFDLGPPSQAPRNVTNLVFSVNYDTRRPQFLVRVQLYI